MTTRSPVAITGLICFACLGPPAAGQSIRYVDDDASTNGDGLSWDTAYKYLQDALFEAEGDPTTTRIRVAGGTYWPDLGEGGQVTEGDRGATFQLSDGLELNGGYRGCPEGDCLGGDPDERDIALYETILSGDLNGDDQPDWVNRGDNSYHVVTGNGTDNTAVLDGFTIAGGNATGPFPRNSGGGMISVSGSPAVRSRICCL